MGSTSGAQRARWSEVSGPKFRVLLDTHVWLWYLLGDAQLKIKHRDVIEQETSELWLSPISLWETHVLIEKRQIPVGDPPSVWIGRALSILRVREAPITFAIAMRSRSLELVHQDPADRFLAATAAEMKAPLLTSDERLQKGKGYVCL